MVRPTSCRLKARDQQNAWDKSGWNASSWRVKTPYVPVCVCVRCVSDESGCLGIQSKIGGKFHLKLNMGSRPIANKYCEGKMKRTLKRELKGLEIAKMEPFGGSVTAADIGRFVMKRSLCVV